MNENPNSASENAATPQAQETVSQSNTAPLAENQYVQELFSILQDNSKDTKGLSALIGHVSEMENFVTRAEQKIADMKTQLAEMKEVQNHPVKTALTNAIKALETKVAAALNNLSKFFHINGALKAVDKSVESTIATCDRSVANINKFADNYHDVGRGIKNMRLIIVGREPVDQKKENGRLAAAMSAPYKAEKASMNGIKKAIGTTLKKLSQLDASVEAKQARRVVEKKPSIIDELEANITKLAAQDRERAVPDKSKQKEAAL